MGLKTVFVSSTIWDLVDVRAEIREFLSRNGFQPVMSECEDFPDDLSQTGTYEKCRQVVVNSDTFLMIVNNRYGGPRDLKEDEVSITHKEFRWAVEHRKPFIGFIRDKLETDRQIWKNTRDEKVLAFVKGKKNLRLFDLLDEIDRSAIDGTALWRRTFRDSVELKRTLAFKLGISDYSNNYLAQAQILNALPRLILQCGPIFGIKDREVDFTISNIGSGAAEQVHILVYDCNGAKIHDQTVRDVLSQGYTEWKHVRILASNGGKLSAIIRYNNVLGSSFESGFLMEFGKDIAQKITKTYFGPPR